MRTVREKKIIRWAGGQIVTIGDTGTFFGGLPGETVRQASGKVLRIQEGPNWGCLWIQDEKGGISVLRY
jgi:hypothetical protein